MLNFTLPFSVSGEQNKFITPVPQLEVGENYYFVGQCSDGTKLLASNCVFVWYNSTTSTSVKVVNPNVTYTAEDLSSANSFYVYLSSALAGKTITSCMLIKGTYDSSNIPAYEPYTNGASPNPDYPQQIHEVSGDNEVVVCGKNIWDEEWEQGYIQFDQSVSNWGQNVSATNQIRSKNYIPIDVAKTYYGYIGNSTMIAIMYDENKQPISNGATGYVNISNQELVLKPNTKYIRFLC